MANVAGEPFGLEADVHLVWLQTMRRQYVVARVAHLSLAVAADSEATERGTVMRRHRLFLLADSR